MVEDDPMENSSFVGKRIFLVSLCTLGPKNFFNPANWSSYLMDPPSMFEQLRDCNTMANLRFCDKLIANRETIAIHAPHRTIAITGIVLVAGLN